MALLHAFLECFIPLLVAIDPLGLLPLFLSVTPNLDDHGRCKLCYRVAAVALAICFAFMFLGQATFNVLGIDVNDFRVAGGIVLLVLAVVDLLSLGKPGVHREEMSGLVPLATPLIAGPATLTTLLVLTTNHGYVLTAAALLATFSILLLTMLAAGRIARLLGTATMEALSKLVMILLAAIAVNFIRTGIVNIARDVPR